MKAVSRVLVRVIVKEFYKENTGFFLVVLGLGFGFFKTAQHVDIASALAFSPIYYLIPLGLWVLYTFKTLNFFYRIKRLPENWFLSDLTALKTIKIKSIAIFIQTLLLAPILAYSLFMIIMAGQLGQADSVLLIVIALVLILMTSAHLLYIRLVQPVDTSLSKNSNDWTRFIPKTYSFLLIRHLMVRHGIALITSKAFSIGIILGATAIYNVEGVDLRYLALGMLLSSAVNASFSFKQVQFEVTSLSLYRNLPISKLSYFGKDILTYLILCVPEALILIGNNAQNVHAVDLLKMVFFIPSMTILYHGLMKWKGMDQETHTKYVFFITAILFFIVLAHVDLLAIEGLMLSISLLLAYAPDKVPA